MTQNNPEGHPVFDLAENANCTDYTTESLNAVADSVYSIINDTIAIRNILFVFFDLCLIEPRHNGYREPRTDLKRNGSFAHYPHFTILGGTSTDSLFEAQKSLADYVAGYKIFFINRFYKGDKTKIRLADGQEAYLYNYYKDKLSLKKLYTITTAMPGTDSLNLVKHKPVKSSYRNNAVNFFPTNSIITFSAYYLKESSTLLLSSVPDEGIDRVRLHLIYYLVNRAQYMLEYDDSSDGNYRFPVSLSSIMPFIPITQVERYYEIYGTGSSDKEKINYVCSILIDIYLKPYTERLDVNKSICSSFIGYRGELQLPRYKLLAGLLAEFPETGCTDKCPLPYHLPLVAHLLVKSFLLIDSIVMSAAHLVERTDAQKAKAKRLAKKNKNPYNPKINAALTRSRNSQWAQHETGFPKTRKMLTELITASQTAHKQEKNNGNAEVADKLLSSLTERAQTLLLKVEDMQNEINTLNDIEYAALRLAALAQQEHFMTRAGEKGNK